MTNKEIASVVYMHLFYDIKSNNVYIPPSEDNEQIKKIMQALEFIETVDNAKMESNVVDRYKNIEQELYDYFKFTPGYVMYPIDTDTLPLYWCIYDNDVIYSPDRQQVIDFIIATQNENEDEDEDNTYENFNDVYVDSIFVTRYYNKYIYPAKDHTMIFCDPHVDHCDWMKIFDNSKEIKLEEINNEIIN